MPKVTDLQFWMEDKLQKKLDIMIDRCSRTHPVKDSLLLIEGGEGEGKSTLAAEVGYYISKQTGRSFSVDNIFFDAEKLLKFAISTEKQIIVYDEPALDCLSAEWWKESQKNLIKLLMMARKKQHFFIFNITKFNKFPEYIVVDRALGMIHVYSRREVEQGRFVYIKKKALEFLYNIYRSSKKRMYKKYSSFRGSFPDRFADIIDVAKYSKVKDDAILQIGQKKDVAKKNVDLSELRFKIAKLPLPINTYEELALNLGINSRRLREWRVYENPLSAVAR